MHAYFYKHLVKASFMNQVLLGLLGQVLYSELTCNCVIGLFWLEKKKKESTKQTNKNK